MSSTHDKHSTLPVCAAAQLARNSGSTSWSRPGFPKSKIVKQHFSKPAIWPPAAGERWRILICYDAAHIELPCVVLG
jgi:hypothetical protein